MTAAKRILGLVAVLVLIAAPGSAATITINNLDAGSGLGFDDPSPPSAPAPGNGGTTLGEQRLAVYEEAARIWGLTLDSTVEIIITSTFNPAAFGQPLTCTPTGATLGAAGAIQVFRDFANAPFAETWYHVALANKLAGTDLTPGPPDPGFLNPGNDDVVAFFNPLLDSDPMCLGGNGWYYGFDHNEESTGGIDLLAVVLHEIGHGLGFSNFVNEATGTEISDGMPGSPCEFGCTDIYSRFTLDLTTGLHWDEMTNAERMASAINDPFVVWDGPAVTALFPDFLGLEPQCVVDPPSAVAGTYDAQAASFGPPVPPGGVAGSLVLADDGTAPDVNDGCEALVNGGAVAGNIALIQRGNCSFVQKVQNAQAAGAVGVKIYNNNPTGLPPMGGSDPTVTIPSVGISQADGQGIVANLPASGALQLGTDRTGTEGGFVRLNMPNPVAPGSSGSHWTNATLPNLLMEPAISGSLGGDFDILDLTTAQYQDIGWMFIGGAPFDADIPTISDIGAGSLILLLLASAFFVLRRRG